MHGTIPKLFELEAATGVLVLTSTERRSRLAEVISYVYVSVAGVAMATGHEMAMGLRAAYGRMHRQSNLCLARRGVTVDQFVLLALLAEQDGITQQELVRRAGSDANTIRAMLVLMEDRGLVARRPHPTDGRAYSVTLTRKGRQALNRLWTESEPVRQRLLAPFTPEEADRLIDFLTRISEAMSEENGSTPTTETERVLKGEER